MKRVSAITGILLWSGVYKLLREPRLADVDVASFRLPCFAGHLLVMGTLC